jgi:hypothetical protein
MSSNICVGRRAYGGRGRVISTPTLPEGHERVVCMINHNPSRGEWGGLGPYHLLYNGWVFENVWQFMKVYPKVPASRETYIDREANVTHTWNHPSEVHVDAHGNPTDAWEKWAEKGITSPFPIRYPVGWGRGVRASCLYSVGFDTEGNIDTSLRYDYITARKKTYLRLYDQVVRLHPDFNTLRDKLKSGGRIMIEEVDGPHQESLPYYMTRYGVGEDFIRGSCVNVTVENMRILINDPLHPFGHGYCLAIALLGMYDEVVAG